MTDCLIRSWGHVIVRRGRFYGVVVIRFRNGILYVPSYSFRFAGELCFGA